METEDTIDIVAIAVIAIVIGFIVYEISQATNALSDAIPGGAGTLATVGGIVALVLFL